MIPEPNADCLWMPWHLCCPEHLWTPWSVGVARTAYPADKELWWSHGVRMQPNCEMLYKNKVQSCEIMVLFCFRMVRFVVFHMCALFITISVSLLTGILTGTYVLIYLSVYFGLILMIWFTANKQTRFFQVFAFLSSVTWYAAKK